MQFTTLLLATVAALATTAFAAPSPVAAPDPKTTLFPKVLKAHCDGTDNDCCFNNYDACRNQHGSISTCLVHPSLCKNFKTDAAHGAHVPSCNGADCCVISTGLGGSCHR